MSDGRFTGETIAGHDQNPAGDTPVGLVEVRCENCGRSLRGYLRAGLPQRAKWECRICGHISHDVKVHDEAMDTIEQHIAEGEYEQRLGRRRSVHLVAGKGFNVLGVKLGGKATRAALVDGPQDRPLIRLAR